MAIRSRSIYGGGLLIVLAVSMSIHSRTFVTNAIYCFSVVQLSSSAALWPGLIFSTRTANSSSGGKECRIHRYACPCRSRSPELWWSDHRDCHNGFRWGRYIKITVLFCPRTACGTAGPYTAGSPEALRRAAARYASLPVSVFAGFLDFLIFSFHRFYSFRTVGVNDKRYWICLK